MRAGTDEAHGALRILQRHIGAIRPAVGREAIAQHEDGDAGAVQAARTFEAFLVEHNTAIAAAGRQQQRGAVRCVGPEDGE